MTSRQMTLLEAAREMARPMSWLDIAFRCTPLFGKHIPIVQTPAERIARKVRGVGSLELAEFFDWQKAKQAP